MKLIKRLTAAIGALGALFVAGPALAAYDLNMPRGVTAISEKIYGLHMQILWICVIIGIVVFGAILYSVIRFRKSKGVVPAQFHHSTTVEIIWTVIPMLILIAVAIPSTKVLIEMEDTGNAGVTIKVTGYQWKWGYDYLEEGISIISTLDRDSNLARQRNPEVQPANVENYLLNVDNPLVVPTDTKIRFLLTANDVIHSWWVPDLGWKKDAIPGFINEASTLITKPGVYRGQCAELCGRDHGFMPIVVVALPPAEYKQWVAEQKQKSGQPVAQAPAAAPQQPAPAQQQSAPQPAAPQQQTAAASGAQSREQLMKTGEQVYTRSCVACHQASGEGMPPAFPALKGSVIATGPVPAHLNIVLNGKPGTAMTAFGALLSDEDIAAVVTYERNAWGNNTGDLVQPADVKAAR